MAASSGLLLASAFYEEYGKSLLQQELPDLMPYMAVGLVGEGSECFGFDDSISQDHDWGPAFCLWLPEQKLEQNLLRIDDVLQNLPLEFRGFATRMRPEQRMERVGPLSIEAFYARYIRSPKVPTRWQDWRIIPEHFLAVCTNGRVFYDGLGEFSAIREALLAFYPEEIRLKKIAARCMGMAQAGQYNLLRSLRRGDTVAAMLAAARFVEQSLSMVYLLNRRYMPFYKWAFRGVASLPLLGECARAQISALAANDWRQGAALVDTVAEEVEILCAAVAEELRRAGLSDVTDDWLLEHGPAVQSCITVPELRTMPAMLE